MLIDDVPKDSRRYKMFLKWYSILCLTIKHKRFNLLYSPCVLTTLKTPWKRVGWVLQSNACYYLDTWDLSDRGAYTQQSTITQYIEAILYYTLGPSEGKNPKIFAVIHQRQPDNTEVQKVWLKSQTVENTCDQNSQWDWLSNQCRSSLIICNDSNHSSSTSSPLQTGRVYSKKLISLTWLECC